MTKISRHRLLGGIAAKSLPVSLPEAAAGMDDFSIVQMLIDAHKAAMERFDSSPQEIWEDSSETAEAISDEMNETAEALCSYRPTTIEGVHLKATYMMSIEDFVGGKELDPQFTHAELAVSCLRICYPKRYPMSVEKAFGARKVRLSA